MSGHFLGLLLAHRTPQHVGATQRVPPDDLGDQHNLLLVHNHTIGALEYRLQIGMEIIDLGAPMLAVDEINHHTRFQGARPIQRQHGNDVFKRVGL